MNVPAKSSLLLKPAFTFTILYLSFAATAQVQKINCIEPRKFTLPAHDIPVEEVHYNNHEGYAFWYRLNITENGDYTYKVEAIEAGSSYEVKLYEFDGIEFCKKLVKEQVDPVASSTSFTWKSKKDRTYFLGVTDLGNYCGHQITFSGDDWQLKTRSTLYGGSCANKGDYEPQAAKEKLPEGKVIIGGKTLQGKVRNVLTAGSVNADMRFYNKQEDYEINTISYRLKGYTVHLEKGRNYNLHIKALGYVPLDTSISISMDTDLDFVLTPVEKGERFIIDNIYFYPNTFAVKPESTEALESLKDYMLENKKLKIEIQGHTNGNKDVKKNKENRKPGEEWNFEGSAKDLSGLRAEKLKEYLVEQGVSKKRITTVGMGGDEMIVKDPKNMEEAAKNIRVEIRIISD